MEEPEQPEQPAPAPPTPPARPAGSRRGVVAAVIVLALVVVIVLSRASGPAARDLRLLAGPADYFVAIDVERILASDVGIDLRDIFRAQLAQFEGEMKQELGFVLDDFDAIAFAGQFDGEEPSVVLHFRRDLGDEEFLHFASRGVRADDGREEIEGCTVLLKENSSYRRERSGEQYLAVCLAEPRTVVVAGFERLKASLREAPSARFRDGLDAALEEADFSKAAVAVLDFAGSDLLRRQFTREFGLPVAPLATVGPLLIEADVDESIHYASRVFERGESGRVIASARAELDGEFFAGILRDLAPLWMGR